MKNAKNADIANIYRLDGQVPVMKAIPFGLQHILAMFVANLTPITIIAGAGGLKQAEIAILLQNAMFVAGIATLIQLYPLWKIGSRLPIVMGVSFTFVTVLSTVAANYGYPSVVGAVLVGGIMEGTLGLLAKYWKKIISPIVAASVVTAIGFSLFYRRYQILWRRLLRRFWLCPESDPRYDNITGMSGLEHSGKRLLEAAFCISRSDRWLYCSHLYGKSRPFCDLFRRHHLFPEIPALCTGISPWSHSFCCNYLSCICC